MKYLLDTHTWLWLTTDASRLSRKVTSVLSEIGRIEELLISAISPWEFCMLLAKKRISLATDDPVAWMGEALDIPKLRMVPLTPAIAYKATTLPEPFHNDPADRIIVASARNEGATILTKDRLIRGYAHVKSLW